MKCRICADPYWITAKYATNCRCGRPIHIGDRVLYYPNGRRVLCTECSHAGWNDLRNEIEGAY